MVLFEYKTRILMWLSEYRTQLLMFVLYFLDFFSLFIAVCFIEDKVVKGFMIVAGCILFGILVLYHRYIIGLEEDTFSISKDLIMGHIPDMDSQSDLNVKYRPRFNDYQSFNGNDTLEVMCTDNEFWFVQEFGGVNYLTDDDVRKLADICLGYLRRKENNVA